MAKVQEQGCGGLRRLVILLSTRLGRVPLALLLAFFFFLLHCRMMNMDNLRRKMQMALQLLLFQAVEGQKMALLGWPAVE